VKLPRRTPPSSHHLPGILACAFLTLAPVLLASSASAAGYRLVGWNNLGMHCMDADYSVLSLLPPFNTINAQLIDPAGNLVLAPGDITVTYEAVADADGSINTTSAGKTNFWDHVGSLFGATPGVDQGLFGANMPGPTNTPQPMYFDPAASWFAADGIPITPRDDAGLPNTYPMMRLVARDGSGAVLATTDIVLPVSEEMTCKACHASGTSPGAAPSSGWVEDPDPERDYRLNILRLHDDRIGSLARFQQALGEVGYNAAGLEATVVEDGGSILCASCHASEALPGSGLDGIPPLTQSIHNAMASAIDPETGMALDAVENRTACYRCHPGSATKCLRGAMGAAVAGDGSLSMQCQSCHGRMTDVGSPMRTGWLEEPRCDSCHTGTATDNNGMIRYLSVFEDDGSVRRAANATFATNDDTPAAGLSLYRFSTGHGGLQCSACHGSTHAVFPSAHDSDNVQSIAIQGHKGVLADCGSCHAVVPRTSNGGPHGMHPIDRQWATGHGDVAEHNASACRACHGADYRGTVLSRAQGDRTFSTDFGTKRFWRGFQIGCYTCHRGPSSESSNPNRAAVVQNATASTTADVPVAIALAASDADRDALTLRVVSQPRHGTAGLVGATATYYPDAGYEGADSFTFAAWDGSTDSNLATATITVGPFVCPDGCQTPDGCDPNCAPPQDAMVSVPEPVRVVIGRRRDSAGRHLSVVVRDLDGVGAASQRVRLVASDGDCPAGTVESVDFGPAAAASGADTVDLTAGDSAEADIAVRVFSSDFDTPSRRAPARCAITLAAVVDGGADPTPANNQARVELNIHDRGDAAPLATVDPFFLSVEPLAATIARGSSSASPMVRLRFGVEGPGDAAHTQLRIIAEDGTCPPGTAGLVDVDPATPGAQDSGPVPAGKRRRGLLPLHLASASFDTPTAPERCSVILSLTYTGSGGDVTNDMTVLPVTVDDANDR
jgi:hypothetical protein